MTNRKVFDKIDEIGVIGQQQKQSDSSKKYHRKKTGAIFRKARAAAKSQSPGRSYSRNSA
jgi:hypothetical protein